MKGGLNKLPEKGVGVHGFRSEFRMELASKKPRMVFQFDDLHQSFIRRNPTEYQSRLSQEDPNRNY